ncbi:MAG: MOSC domain-containing protein [Xanthomonadales bacterium]|nr:MOSC domain-containing protein [Xanthomonadales bacterium]
MKILSVNVAQPRAVEYQGKTVQSSIWKEPVQGRVALSETNLAGDRQATALLHGGIHKAVYAFSHDQYAWWETELQRNDLKPGMFGENLTVSGLDESNIGIGDQWQVAAVRFVVTGPRIPCSNLAMKFNDRSAPRRFAESGRPGVYLRVLHTGSVAGGDTITEVSKGDGVTIRELYQAYTRPRDVGSREILQQALRNEYLDPDLATGIGKRILDTQQTKEETLS